MASVMNRKESKGFCDDVYTQLIDMKEKVLKLKDRSVAGIPVSDIDGGKFSRHLTELADAIDWKLQILSHVCPYDWKGSMEYTENTASVGPVEKIEDFSPGYVGG